MLDDRLRSTARAARAQTEATIDVDAAWRELQGRVAGDDVIDLDAARRRRVSTRRWVVGASIAAAFVAVMGVGYLARRPDTVSVNDTTPPTAPTTVSTIAPDLVPVPTSVPVPTAPPVTESTAPPVTGEPIAVSYLSTPPEATPNVFASYSAPESLQFVLGELGALQQSFGVASIYGYDGGFRTVQLDASLADVVPIAYGPGDVMYGTRLVGTPADVEVVAVPLAGARAGSVVASVSVGVSSEFTESPTVGFGHGPTGIVNLAVEPGRVLLEYVDESGAPLAWAQAPPAVASRDDSDLVVAGDRAWQLAIERHPDGGTGGNSFTGPNGVAPGPGGTYVYETTIGPLEDPTADFTQGTVPVIATLLPDGTGRWEAIPEGWRLESISPWGVLVSRLNPETFVYELALLTEVPIVDPLAALRDFPMTDTGFAFACNDSGFCAQLVVGPDGVIVSYDPTTGTLTRHDESSTSAAQVDPQRSPFIVAAGPDAVVYLAMQSEGIVDPVGDLVAIALEPGTAGREVRRWTEVLDMSGDTDLVATPDGIVAVGCCGPDMVRPAPDADVTYPWLDQSGSEVSDQRPLIVWQPSEQIVTIGERQWALDVPDGAGFRGMPPIVATADGGFVAALFNDDGRTTLVRGSADGTSHEITVDAFPALLHPDGSFWFADGERVVIVHPFPG